MNQTNYNQTNYNQADEIKRLNLVIQELKAEHKKIHELDQHLIDNYVAQINQVEREAYSRGYLDGYNVSQDEKHLVEAGEI